MPQPRADRSQNARDRALGAATPSSPRDAAYPDLQAAAAHLYGLTLEELEHVLGTFPRCASVQLLHER